MPKVIITGGGLSTKFGRLVRGQELHGGLQDLRSLVEGGMARWGEEATPSAREEAPEGAAPLSPDQVVGLTGPAAREYVRGLDEAGLREAHAAERDNERYPGGRRTVLDAIEEALGEFSVEDPNDGGLTDE